MIGLERGIVKLTPYTAEWKRLFEKEKARLQVAIGDYVLDIQHVGSTSIPGNGKSLLIERVLQLARSQRRTIR